MLEKIFGDRHELITGIPIFSGCNQILIVPGVVYLEKADFD